MSSRWLVIAVMFAGAACAGDGPVPPAPFEGFLTVWNRNSVSPEQPAFYEILELYVHDSSSHQGAAELLGGQPLAIDGRLAVGFNSGQYVTTVRRRNIGQDLALTTGRGIDIDSSCFVLEVFDETFRLKVNGDVALPALAAAGQVASCSVSRSEGGPDDGGGGDPAPGD